MFIIRNYHVAHLGDIMMNIYDFDKTIYNGDSSVDFIKYCFKTNKKTLLILPKFILTVFLYLIKVCEKEQLKSSFFKVITYFDDVDQLVKDFWKENEHKLKDFYLKNKKKTDIIISASPEFLLQPIAQKYKFTLIGTKVDLKTGKLIGNNCYGIEKIVRLQEKGITKCNNFYSDSLSDTPVANIAKKAYIVKGEELIRWDSYKEKGSKKLLKLFLNRDFITFVAIGIINVINGIWIAYAYSLFITDPILAYIIGFLTSLCISYILNSIFNFKQKISFNKFIKFVINNIFNFIIQVLSVVLLINKLKFDKLLAYAISAIIAVPVTFILLKINVFKKEDN